MDQAAERAVLGCILYRQSLLGVARSMRLLPKDFQSMECKIVFRAMCSMEDEGLSIDTLSVRETLAQQDRLASVGGPAFLHSLDADLPDAGHFETYVKAVKAGSVRTLMMRQSLQLKTLASSEELGLEELAASAAGLITEVVEAAHDGSSGTTSVGDATDAAIRSLKAGRGPSIETGLNDLDDRIIGLHPGGFYVVAGRPGMGKTALATNWCVHAAENDKSVGIFSLEMSAEEISSRILSAESGISLTKMKQGALSDHEWAVVNAARNDIANYSIEIDDSGAIYTIEGLMSRAKSMSSRKRLDLICVDYIQLLESNNSPRANRTEQVSSISRSLKRLAKELNVPVIGISQLTREVERRADKRPMLSDLRESGSIEQDADVVIFVFRPGYYQQQDNTNGKSELIIAKHRQGEGGTVFARWVGETTQFVNSSSFRPKSP